jgi:hypothetical protein
MKHACIPTEFEENIFSLLHILCDNPQVHTRLFNESVKEKATLQTTSHGTGLQLKNAAFWDVTPCGSYKQFFAACLVASYC